MIIPISGKVSYPITLDPSVWIFDDRKVLLDEAFNLNREQGKEQGVAEQTAKRLDEAYLRKIRPPVNQSISKFEREQALKNSYVMPVKEFIEHAELQEDASFATLVTKTGNVDLSLSELKNSLLLFSIDGKPLKDDGPVHLLFQDGSNQQAPIKGVEQMIIK